MRARRRWDAWYFGFSMAPDTNINAASDAEFIYINNLPFRRGRTGRASSDIGIVGWGGGEYQYPLAERWRLRSGVSTSTTGSTRGTGSTRRFWQVYVGPRWLITRDTEMSLLATASQRWWGGSSFNYDYGARLEVLHRVFAGLRLSGRAQWSDRKFQQQKFLEGPLMVFSLGARYVLFPDRAGQRPGRLSTAGYACFTPGAVPGTGRGWGRTWRCRGALPWALAPSSGGRITRAGGFRSSLITRRPAQDQTRILQATLLNRAITVFGFSPRSRFPTRSAIPTRNCSTSNATSWKCAGSGSFKIGAVPPL